MASDTTPIAEQGVATLSDEAWAKARHRTDIIGPLATLEVVGHEAADAAAQALGLSRRQVYVLIRRARQGTGLLTDLAPGRSGGGKGKGRLPEPVERIIRELLQKRFLTKQKRSLAAFHREVAQVCKAQQLRVPARNTVARRIADLYPLKATRRREARMRRAHIILLSANGVHTAEIAKACGTTRPTVSRWRTRFRQAGLAGLYDELREGRPRSIDDERVATMISTVLEQSPPNSTHWTTRSVAEATGISKSQVHRYFQSFGLQPHRTKTFKLSNDPFFVEKVRDIVGLYLNPPDKALVLCVDEKSQIQALERTQPILPLGLGYVEGITHDYVRHGTTTLFAALDVASGEVMAQCKKRHRHQEFLSVLNHIEKNVPQHLDVHLILDNYATHKHAKVKAWLAKRPRYHVHFTPTYSSWLNQVERWFGLITQQAIRRGSFKSPRELVQKIDDYVVRYNDKASPFAWTATADSILAKLERLCNAISGTPH